MSKEAHITSVRLLVAGLGSLLLLAGVVFPIFALFGRTLGAVIPAVLCICILVFLTPVVIWGSWRERLLAVMLGIFPALLLVAMIVFSLAFAR